MTKFASNASVQTRRTSLRNQFNSETQKSLKVPDYHSKDLEIESNAPPKAGWKVSRPQTSELKFDAAEEALKQRSSNEQKIAQGEKQAQAFKKLTKQRVAKSIESGKIKTGGKNKRKNVGPTEDRPKKNFQKAYSTAKDNVDAFAKIV